MKIKSIICAFLILITSSLSAQATQLPKELKDYLMIQKKVPTIRFDAVVVYGPNVMYLPVFPAYPEKVDAIKIKETYPKNQTMDQLPDMVLFNNNIGLLKIIRTDNQTLSVRNIENLPVEIKTGLIPQDIMVPRGLILPENLAGILGDVQIPMYGSARTSGFITSRKTAPLPGGKRVAEVKREKVPNSLKNKLFFVNNFQTEYLQVFSPAVSEPLYSLKTSGVMKDIKPILNGKFLLAATANKKNLDVIDVDNEYVAKNIDLTAYPTEIAVDNENKKAYVASIKDESLSVIDLDKMAFKEKIQLVGAPQRLSVSDDGKRLAYEDMKTSAIYVLDLDMNYENKLITTYPNTSKLILKDNVIYAIARTQPKLRIINFDLLQDNQVSKSKKQRILEKEQIKAEKQNAEDVTDSLVYIDEQNTDVVSDLVENVKMYSTSIKDVNVGIKPIDMYYRDGKIYVLCAGDNSVHVYDTKTGEVKITALNTEGFAKAFTPVPDSNLAVITNMANYKYAVYDMEKDKVLQTQPVNDYINMITILERRNGQ